MSDEREVSEVSLDGGVQQGLGSGVAEGRPVLVQQVHQLLGYGSESTWLEPGLGSGWTPYLVARTRSFLLYCSAVSWLSLTMYSAICRAGNSVSQT